MPLKGDRDNIDKSKPNLSDAGGSSSDENYFSSDIFNAKMLTNTI